MGLAFNEIAIRLQIGVGTADRLYVKYVDTGDVALNMMNWTIVHDENWVLVREWMHSWNKPSSNEVLKFVRICRTHW